MNNGFRLGFLGRDHGYQPGPPRRPEPAKNQGSRSSRSPRAFGTPGGSIEGLGGGRL